MVVSLVGGVGALVELKASVNQRPAGGTRIVCGEFPAHDDFVGDIHWRKMHKGGLKQQAKAARVFAVADPGSARLLPDKLPEPGAGPGGQQADNRLSVLVAQALEVVVSEGERGRILV